MTLLAKLKIWIKKPENYFYLILAIVCLAIGSRKYDFWILIIVIAGVFILTYLIGKLILMFKDRRNS